jgi:hypothetical protein
MAVRLTKRGKQSDDVVAVDAVRLKRQVAPDRKNGGKTN